MLRATTAYTIFRHLNFQKCPERGVLYTFWLRNVLRAITAYTFSTSQLPKVLWTWCALYILTSTCASRYNNVHFFDISTSKSGLRMVCLVVLCTFWLGNVLRATTVCTFSTSQRPKVVWEWCFDVFCTFWLGNVLRAAMACNFSSLIWPNGSAPTALASLLFDPPEPQIIGKTQCFATFLPFRTCIFFLITLSLLWSSLFCSSPLWLCPFCRKFDSKLPSTIMVRWEIAKLLFGFVVSHLWMPMEVKECQGLWAMLETTHRKGASLLKQLQFRGS